MPAAKRFEDLRMWQQARTLSNLTYQLTAQPSFRDSDLRSQMRRAAVSVMSNIAEDFGRGSNEEFQRFLFIAKGSLTELQSQLYLARDLTYLSENQFKQASEQCDTTAKMIQKFAQAMKAAGRSSFRHRRQRIPWADRVEQIMKEIQEATKEE